MADEHTEHTEVGELRYDLRSRATVASNDIRSYGSHEMDPAVGEHSAEGKPGTTARARPEIPRFSPITEIKKESQTSGSMPFIQAIQHRHNQFTH